MLCWARQQGIEVGTFCALHTYGRQLNQHLHIYVSVTRGGLDITHSTWRSVKYLGRYLKRAPVAASQLRHYRGGAVVQQYYDHRTQRHKRQKISQEEMLQRYISHILARYFNMVRYYGFLANSKRGSLLPKVYDALEMTVREKPKRPQFAVLMKGFLGTDPYQCILCKGRLCFVGAVAAEHATKMLSDRLQRMEKNDDFQAPALDKCA
nr:MULTISPECIES: transposase [Serratia]